MPSIAPVSRSGQRAPQFQDKPSCRAWLRALPLTNVQLSHTALHTQLRLLNRYAAAPLERLKIMEELREAAAFLQGELGRQYWSQAAPLNNSGQAAWDSVVELWREILDGYRICLNEGRGDAAMTAYIPLATQRCLRYGGLLVLEFYRVYRELPAAVWEDLHAFYRFAEGGRFVAQPVKDRLSQAGSSSTCQGVYLQTVLIHLANPYQFTPKQLAIVYRWLDAWAVRAVLLPAGEIPSRPVAAVDVGGAAPPSHESAALTAPRYLDTRRLAATLKKRIHRLQQGDQSAAIGLGADCAQPGCERLLAQVYHYWCRGRPRRILPRRHASPRAELCFGLDAGYFHVAGGKPFTQPQRESGLKRDDLEDLRLLNRVAAMSTPMASTATDAPLEVWEIRDESALGFGLLRHPRQGAPVAQNQLVAVRPFDGKCFALGSVRWLTIGAVNDLQAGIRIFPGVPVPLAARPWPCDPETERFAPAFLLPAVAAVHSVETLVLPSELYRQGQLEVVAAETQYTVTLTGLLEKGRGYVLVAFTRSTTSR